MLLCQLSNLNVLLALILNQYMVDVLFSAAPDIEARLLLPTRQARLRENMVGVNMVLA